MWTVTLILLSLGYPVAKCDDDIDCKYEKKEKIQK